MLKNFIYGLEILGLMLIVSLLILAFTKFYIRERTKIRCEQGIEELKSINIGGINQWIYIRGKNMDNPVILWLDGGPGEPLIAYSRDIGFKTKLEEDFTFVYWEQRGTGKSFNKAIKSKDMKVEKFVSDIEEITNYIKNRFKKNKVYLVGRSWGTRIGLITAEKNPENYYAFVGIGQAVNSNMSDLDGYKFAVETAKMNNYKKDLEELEKIGLPPYDEKELFIQRKYVIKYRGFSIGGKDLRKYIAKNIFISPEYTLLDAINVILNQNFAIRNMRNEILAMNIFEKIKHVNIPIYFFEGRKDNMVSSRIAEKYFNFVTAKQKKLVWFENSAHVVNDDEPEKFRREMLKVLEDTYQVENKR